MGIRVKEHNADLKLGTKGTFSLNDQPIDIKHQVDKCKSNILRECKKGRIMNILEQLEIEKRKETCKLLNAQVKVK